MKEAETKKLHENILLAHERNDLYGLADLYALAAEQKRAERDEDAAGFLLTQAYVYALDSAHPALESLRDQLVAEGREEAE